MNRLSWDKPFWVLTLWNAISGSYGTMSTLHPALSHGDLMMKMANQEKSWLQLDLNQWPWTLLSMALCEWPPMALNRGNTHTLATSYRYCLLQLSPVAGVTHTLATSYRYCLLQLSPVAEVTHTLATSYRYCLLQLSPVAEVTHTLATSCRYCLFQLSPVTGVTHLPRHATTAHFSSAQCWHVTTHREVVKLHCPFSCCFRSSPFGVVINYPLLVLLSIIPFWCCFQLSPFGVVFNHPGTLSALSVWFSINTINIHWLHAHVFTSRCDWLVVTVYISCHFKVTWTKN